MEKLFGADIFLSVSLEGEGGFGKGIFIQAKYDRNLKREELSQSISKMKVIVGSKGSYVGVYTPNGVEVFSAGQVNGMERRSFGEQRPRAVEGFAGRILDCYAGSRNWGISAPLPRRREAVAARLRETRSRNIIDLRLEKRS
jgi:hypothetical protein